MIHPATILGHKQEWLHLDHLSGQDLLPLLRHTALRVRSWSMFPTIHKDDRLELGQPGQVLVDDIVVYRQAGALVCHRVKAIDADGVIITTSDATNRGTDAINPREIVGRVTSIYRGKHRLASTHATLPAPVAFLRRYLDGLHRVTSSRLRSIVVRFLDWLTSHTSTRRFLSRAFMRCLRFLVTERIPVTSIPICPNSDRAIPAFDIEETRSRIRHIDRKKHLIVQAYLGPYPVGNLNLQSGEQRLRSSLTGWGLEDYFAGLLEVWLGPRDLIDRSDDYAGSAHAIEVRKPPYFVL